MAGKKASGASYAPLTQAYTQINGRPVRFVMPHPLKFANGQVDVPNDVQADIYRLLFNPFEVVPPEKQFLYDQRYHRSLLYLYQLVCTPRVQLDEDEEGEISALELGWPDLMAGFQFFRYGPSEPVSLADDQDAGAGAATPSTGDDVPPRAE
jgi:hypothetical protein